MLRYMAQPSYFLSESSSILITLGCSRQSAVSLWAENLIIGWMPYDIIMQLRILTNYQKNTYSNFEIHDVIGAQSDKIWDFVIDK